MLFFAVTFAINILSLAIAEEKKSLYVNGYYDAKNDWFVFEWERRDEGIIKSIYDPPNKIQPTIKGFAGYDKQSNTYSYNYEVSNDKNAKQVLSKISVPFKEPIIESKAPFPEADWLIGEYRNYKVWEWYNENAIPPGETAEGLYIKSKGIPTMVDSKFFGEKRAKYFTPTDADTLEADIKMSEFFVKLKAEYPEKFKKVTLKTIGPGELPKDFNALTFIDSIITMKHEAVKLGWITNDGIIKSLDAKLDNAKKAIAGNNMTSAKNLLEAFIKEVEAQGCPTIDDCPKGKHLTSEAYALLKYNVLYLLDRL